MRLSKDFSIYLLNFLCVISRHALGIRNEELLVFLLHDLGTLEGRGGEPVYSIDYVPVVLLHLHIPCDVHTGHVNFFIYIFDSRPLALYEGKQMCGCFLFGSLYSRKNTLEGRRVRMYPSKSNKLSNNSYRHL